MALPLAGCAPDSPPGAAVGGVTLALDRPVVDGDLVRLLAGAEITDLNARDGGDGQELIVRLVKMPVGGECVPETRVICAHDVYLAVSERDEEPRRGLFHLGVVGDVTFVRWGEPGGTDRAEIVLEAARHPADAVTLNPALGTETVTYRLEVRVDALRLLE